jgi:hypothetical protein
MPERDYVAPARRRRYAAFLCIVPPLPALPLPHKRTGEDGMDGRHVVQRVVNGDSVLAIARGYGYISATPVYKAARAFIIEKLGSERYSALADQPGMGPGRIARTLGKEALQKD